MRARALFRGLSAQNETACLTKVLKLVCALQMRTNKQTAWSSVRAPVHSGDFARAEKVRTVILEAAAVVTS